MEKKIHKYIQIYQGNIFLNKLKDVLHFNFLEYDFLPFFCFNNLTSIIEK